MEETPFIPAGFFLKSIVLWLIDRYTIEERANRDIDLEYNIASPSGRSGKNLTIELYDKRSVVHTWGAIRNLPGSLLESGRFFHEERNPPALPVESEAFPSVSFDRDNRPIKTGSSEFAHRNQPGGT